MTKRKHPKDSKRPVFFSSYTSQLILRRRQVGRNNAADLYRTTYNHLLRFNRNTDIRLGDITPALVARFMEYLRTGGLKTNSINTYISNLRAIFNEARREGLLTGAVVCPFSHIVLHREIAGARALPEQTISEIASLKPNVPELQQTVDFCTFSYLACGMPFVDLVRLTKENLHNGELIYQRKKTGTLIRIGLTEGMRILITKYSDPASPYLFPILTPESTTHEGYKQCLRQYNANLLKLGEEFLEHPVRLTSYVFRHSWATEARRKNTPLAIISQALGHTSEKTTRFYLATLEQSEIDKANRIVTAAIDSILVQAC